MSDRIYNFGAGPATLPEPVLRQAQQDLWEIGGTGIGILEHSHRGRTFERILQETQERMRALSGMPDGYRILFIQGGASLQFAMVPMNLLPPGGTADYLITGAWSQKAAQEARLFGTVHEAASSADRSFACIPGREEIRYSERPAYVHFTTNNTIFGTQWAEEPVPPAGVPLIADASSDLFSRPIDVSRYGLIYAGAQKNLGAAGVTVVIVREDLVEPVREGLPTVLRYGTYEKENSLYNTPPTMSIYVVGLMMKWIQEQGGLAAVAARNEEKAALLYDFLDGSGFFRAVAEPGSRSRMNVCFRAASEAQEAEFVRQAEREGFSGLKGHRSVGGMRASLYNGCSLEACRALVAFMQRFERENR